jgi:hypothetical protein
MPAETIAELADLESARVALQTRLRIPFPNVQVSITIQLTDDDDSISVIARDYSTPDAPIVWTAGLPFPGVPSVLSWIQWLSTAPL